MDKKSDYSGIWVGVFVILLISIILAVVTFISLPDKKVSNETNPDIYNVTESQSKYIIEPHWNHMPLTYDIYECSENKKERVITALGYVEEKTEGIDFIEYEWEEGEDYNPDIFIICEDIRKDAGYIAGEAIYDIIDRTWIVNGTIFFYKSFHCSGQRPVNEIHEILHLFGLPDTSEESKYWKDVMYPYALGCDADISDEDVEYLNNIYG